MRKVTATMLPELKTFIPNIESLDRRLEVSCAIVESIINENSSAEVALPYDVTLPMELATNSILTQCLQNECDLRDLVVDWNQVHESVIEIIDRDIYDGLTVGEIQVVTGHSGFTKHINNILEIFHHVASVFGKKFIQLPNFNVVDFDVGNEVSIDDRKGYCLIRQYYNY